MAFCDHRNDRTKLCLSLRYSVREAQGVAQALAITEDPVVVEILLDAGGKKQLKQRSNVGYMPLHYAAAFNNNPDVAKFLIDAGADLEATDKKFFAGYLEFYYTPLHMAAKHNENPAVIVTLLKAGADPNRRSLHGSPLHLAAANAEELAVVKALLDAGADLHAKDVFNKAMPLHDAAAYNENPAVIEILLKAGGRPDGAGQGQSYSPTLCFQA